MGEREIAVPFFDVIINIQFEINLFGSTLAESLNFHKNILENRACRIYNNKNEEQKGEHSKNCAIRKWKEKEDLK